MDWQEANPTHPASQDLLDDVLESLRALSNYPNRVAVMQKGQIVETLRTANLLEDMQHPYTTMLFDASNHRVDLPDAVCRWCDQLAGRRRLLAQMSESPIFVLQKV